jgi:hypothetical protein
MAGALKPSAIYFFAGVGVPVGQRHELQEWAKTNHNVELDIIDAAGLAEQLSMRDVFWIAVRYLNVSPEVFPQTDAEEGYSAAKRKWLGWQTGAGNFADFVEVKRAARRALDDFQEDLPRWIQKLADFENQFSDSALWVRATYEIIALTMRLTRSLHGQEERIRKFMGREIAILLPDEIQDVQTITSYAWTARSLGASSLSEEEIRQWFELIHQTIDRGLANPVSLNQKCLWLKEAGRLRFHLEILDGRLPDPGEVYQPWLELSTEVVRALTFPVQDFHDDILRTIEIIGEDSIFDRILENLRPTIQERIGDAAVAESHFERAKQLVEHHHTVRALQELHTAKIQWSTGDTLGPSVLCCLILANCYADLGLHYASLYYALSASYVAMNSNADWLIQRTGEGVFRASESAYRQGHVWLAWELAETALILHHKVAADPWNLNHQESFKRFFHNLPLILVTVEKLSPTHYQQMLADLKRWGLHSAIEPLLREARSLFSKWDLKRFREGLNNTFSGPPFSDCGNVCTCMWAAHGLRFCARWKNSYDCNRYAGEFVALFQVALADLERMDLDIVPGTVLLDIKMTDDLQWKASQVPSNEVHHWRVTLPKTQKSGNEAVDEVVSAMLPVFYEILRGLSVMSDEDFFQHVKDDWSPRTFQHAFFARRYSEQFECFVPRVRCNQITTNATEYQIPSEEWYPKECEELQWFGGLHPRFDEPEEISRVQRRYDVCAAGLRYTLPKFRSDPRFRKMIEKFRSEGWKDWHILSGILNVVTSIRVSRRLGADRPTNEWSTEFRNELFRPEEQNAAEVSADQVSEEAIRATILANIQSTMAGNGLAPSSITPNVEGVKRYMKERWRYFDLDVPHGDLLNA